MEHVCRSNDKRDLMLWHVSSQLVHACMPSDKQLHPPTRLSANRYKKAEVN
jgi:hypothetical protein